MRVLPIDRRTGNDRRSGKDRRSNEGYTGSTEITQNTTGGAAQLEEHLVANGHEFEIRHRNLKVKFDFECSEGLARDMLGEFAQLLENWSSQRQARQPLTTGKEGQDKSQPLDLGSTESRAIALDRVRPSPQQVDGPGSGESPRAPMGWKKSRLLGLILIVGLGFAFAKLGLLAYEKKKALEFAEAQQAEENRKVYEALLSSNLDNLLTRLDQLTSNSRMRKVFPEITSMSGIARFKRGPEPAEKAKAAAEFLYRVKTIFDYWVERGSDFPQEDRPARDDITYFLSVWKETEPLLEQFQAARQDPSVLLNTLPQKNKVASGSTGRP